MCLLNPQNFCEMQNLQNTSTAFLSSFPLWPRVPLSQSPHPVTLALGHHHSFSGWTLPEFLLLPPNPVHYVQTFPLSPEQHFLPNLLLGSCYCCFLSEAFACGIWMPQFYVGQKKGEIDTLLLADKDSSCHIWSGGLLAWSQLITDGIFRREVIFFNWTT